MSSRFTLKPIAAATLAALLAAGPVHAERVIQEEVAVSPGHQITPQEEVTISSSAVKVLRHIADARSALQGDKADPEKAKNELTQSEKLLDIIQAALPTTEVKDRIWVAKKRLEYENTDEVLPDLIPIYASLDELVDYVPTAKAKAHLENAEQALKKGDKSEATEQLQAVDEALVYVEADLPLNSTRHLVAQAKAQLAKEDTKGADQTLAAAEDNVMFVSFSYDTPLIQAKAALYRAWQDYQLGEKSIAKADLNTAVNYLERAAQSGDQMTRNLAANLVTNVRDLSSQIDVDGKSLNSHLQNIWHRAKAISERYAEYISTGWQRFRAEGAGKKDLIEAKLQLTYAQIDHFTVNNDAAAKIELAEAKGYLGTAAEKVMADRRAEVEKLSVQVSELEKALDDADLSHAPATAFTDIESHLAVLIRQL